MSTVAVPNSILCVLVATTKQQVMFCAVATAIPQAAASLPPVPTAAPPTPAENLVKLCSSASPSAISLGVGGSYLLQENGNSIAVFKPQSEEPGMPNNPKGNASGPDSQRRGFEPGELYLREAAAYLLDHDNFSAVPVTTVVSSPTKGSLQQFVPSTDSAEDLGANLFPVHEVQKIAILDIRIANCDRHSGNILVNRDAHGTTLHPIDHGYSLPETLEDFYVDWMYWPQARAPLSHAALAYIASLDPDRDAAELGAALPISPAALLCHRVSSHYLKASAAKGRTLATMAQGMTRPSLDEPSDLENLCTRVANDLLGSEDALWSPSLVAGVDADAFIAKLLPEL